MRFGVVLVMALWAFFVSASIDAATLTVDLGGTGEYTAIQPALDAATDGDTVLVKAGKYTIQEPVDFNRLYRKGEADSPLLKNMTLRAESGPEMTRVVLAATIRDPREAVVLRFRSGEDRRSTVEGFTLTRDRTAPISTDASNGCGVWCADASPTFIDCRISRNRGSGLYCAERAMPHLTDCTLDKNWGTGVWCNADSSPSLTGCSISGNTQSGVHLYTNASNPRPALTRCRIADNGQYGVFCDEGSTPVLDHCTVSGNSYAGLALSYDSSPRIVSCIVWGNRGDALERLTTCAPVIEFSCMENLGWDGNGNVGEDPLFCGWGPESGVVVSAASPDPGDGSADHPFRELASALSFDLALSGMSPCIGTGDGGTNMGAFPASCAEPGTSTRSVELRPGAYDIHGSNLIHHASILGSGMDVTSIEGTVFGLRTGSVLSDLTVRGGVSGGIRVDEWESPAIENVAICGNDGPGVECRNGSAPFLAHCRISGNRAGRAGGGVLCGYQSLPHLSDCVISGNLASEGGGVYCEGAQPTFSHCTISGNAADRGGGIYINMEPPFFVPNVPSLSHCIVWGNSGGAIELSAFAGLDAGYSCLETPMDLPSTNISEDPRFCGGGMASTIHVDGAAQEPGDGSPEHPYPDLASALEYSLSISGDSPCVAGGEGGSDIGAATGYCDGAGANSPRVRIAPGTYDIGRNNLAHGVTLEGAGRDRTVIRGTLFGLRTGTSVSSLTVTGGDRGGIRIGASESPEVREVLVTRNGHKPEYGTEGAVHCEGGSPTLMDCTVSDNLGGGVVGQLGSPTLVRCTMERNQLVGFSWYEGSLALTDCAFRENVSTGVVLEHSTGTMADCAIARNSFGGVSCHLSSVLIQGCEISGNSGDWWRSGFDCGWSDCPGPNAVLEGCRIVGNWNKGGCSGVAGGTVTLINCLVAGNFGDGVCGCSWDSAPILVNCSLSGNSGAAVRCTINASCPLHLPHLTNCIAWRNGEPGCCAEQTSCLVDEDPSFAGEGSFDFTRFEEIDVGGTRCTLPDFVVERPDFRIPPWSPARDEGSAEGAPANDIDGHIRPQCRGVDIGAYEAEECDPAVKFLRGDAGADGSLSITDAIVVLGHLFLGTMPPGCLDSADANDDGVLDLTDAIYVLSYQFLGGSPPGSPFPACGIDPTIDSLDCWSHPPCR